MLSQLTGSQLGKRARSEEGSGDGEARVDDETCAVCLTEPREMLQVECGHRVVCAECTVRIIFSEARKLL